MKIKKLPPAKSASMSQAILLGSISSSCCVIQLMINMMSYVGIMSGFGCAGFNTILGPLRPILRFLTFVWLVWNWFQTTSSKSDCCSNHHGNRVNVNANVNSDMAPTGSTHNNNNNNNNNIQTGTRKGKKWRLILESCVCLVLMFSPEMVTLYGNYVNHGELSLPSLYYHIMHQKQLNSDPSSQHIHTNHQLIRLNYVVDNMGCEACINAVERLIRGQDGVVKSSVTSFDTGEVEIYLRDDVHEEKGHSFKKKLFEENLNKMLQTHGYELHERGRVTKKMKMNNVQTNDSLFMIADEDL